MTETTYLAPLETFLTLGDPKKLANSNIREYPNYVEQYGLTAAHIPDLIRMMLAHTRAEFQEPDDWAAVHAWRSLGQLRAAEAVQPMIDVLVEDVWEDWAWEELPDMWALIGEAAIDPLQRYLQRHAGNPDAELIITSAGLEKIGDAHEHLHERIIEILINFLKQAPTNDPTFNACIIATLGNWKVESAVSLIKRTFENDYVDTSYINWENVEVLFGWREAPPMPDLTEEDFSPQNILEALKRLADMSQSSNKKKGKAMPATATEVERDSIKDWYKDFEVKPEVSEKEKEKKKAKRQQAKKSRQQNRKKK